MCKSDTDTEQDTGQEPTDPLCQDFLAGVQCHSHKMAGSLTSTPDIQVGAFLDELSEI